MNPGETIELHTNIEVSTENIEEYDTKKSYVENNIVTYIKNWKEN